MAAPIAAYVQAGPLWVHEAGDVITYNVNVENRTRKTDIDPQDRHRCPCQGRLRQRHSVVVA